MARVRTVVGGIGLAAALATSGCGQNDSSPRPDAAASAARPEQVTCGDLRAKADLARVADGVTDRLVAPEGQPRTETRALVVRSLRDTCRQPELPGVDDPAAYRPVEPVLKAIQQELDEHEIFED